MILQLSQEYGYVLLAAVVMSIEVILIGFLGPGKLRAKYFTQ